MTDSVVLVTVEAAAEPERSLLDPTTPLLAIVLVESVAPVLVVVVVVAEVVSASCRLSTSCIFGWPLRATSWRNWAPERGVSCIDREGRVCELTAREDESVCECVSCVGCVCWGSEASGRRQVEAPPAA